ncbi:sulfotransferase family 2 domain-containing protein [Chondrinema litorale]|uniref:sulfotransferase family 2 domain-containing protein n=1 Tax=Chondrinema litorale TaxID=2994555 RepID=UPI002543E987|nr:sulfotransferase family 2 domain-containing protein [Chondrinema litorale]UZR99501.1 sulfotransferase family 2 domain-containing protein [Chondrinema litorale]
MISHKHKVIFIHIPKCAGSSVESYFGVKPFNWEEPNYENLTGWCPERKIHLHHATASQLLDLELVSKETWDEYYKFTIVRNPWSRAMSDYYWVQKDCKVRGTFSSFINKHAPFKKHLTYPPKNKHFRGDHLYPQSSYLKCKDGNLLVDDIIKFENLRQGFEGICEKLNLPSSKLPHKKKRSKKRFEHYSHFFCRKKHRLISEKYKEDIVSFGYQFDNRNKQKNIIHSLKYSMVKLYDSSQRGYYKHFK